MCINTFQMTAFIPTWPATTQFLLSLPAGLLVHWPRTRLSLLLPAYVWNAFSLPHVSYSTSPCPFDPQLLQDMPISTYFHGFII